MTVASCEIVADGSTVDMVGQAISSIAAGSGRCGCIESRRLRLFVLTLAPPTSADVNARAAGGRVVELRPGFEGWIFAELRSQQTGRGLAQTLFETRERLGTKFHQVRVRLVLAQEHRSGTQRHAGAPQATQGPRLRE